MHKEYIKQKYKSLVEKFASIMLICKFIKIWTSHIKPATWYVTYPLNNLFSLPTVGPTEAFRASEKLKMVSKI